MAAERTTYTTPHRAREWLAAVIPELEGMTQKGGEVAAQFEARRRTKLQQLAGFEVDLGAARRALHSPAAPTPTPSAIALRPHQPAEVVVGSPLESADETVVEIALLKATGIRADAVGRVVGRRADEVVVVVPHVLEQREVVCV